MVYVYININIRMLADANEFLEVISCELCLYKCSIYVTRFEPIYHENQLFQPNWIIQRH